MSENDISLGFSNLTHDQAVSLLQFHQGLVERAAGKVAKPAAAPKPVGAAPQPLGNPPVPVPPAAPLSSPAAAATATPAPSALSAAAGTQLDVNGVPWHPDYHSGSATEPKANPDGSWRMRRGANKDAVKAFEGQFKGKSQAAATPAPTPVAPSPVGTLPSIGTGAPTPLAPAPIPAPVPLPPQHDVPNFETFQALWVHLVATGQATAELENWLVNTYGGHPTNPATSGVFLLDADKRKAAWDVLKTFDQKAAA